MMFKLRRDSFCSGSRMKSRSRSKEKRNPVTGKVAQNNWKHTFGKHYDSVSRRRNFTETLLPYMKNQQRRLVAWHVNCITYSVGVTRCLPACPQMTGRNRVWIITGAGDDGAPLHRQRNETLQRETSSQTPADYQKRNLRKLWLLERSLYTQHVTVALDIYLNSLLLATPRSTYNAARCLLTDRTGQPSPSYFSSVCFFFEYRVITARYVRNVGNERTVFIDWLRRFFHSWRESDQPMISAACQYFVCLHLSWRSRIHKHFDL